ncbi:MAG TPA: antibiotic biosynthesis monooxygenase [Candidatus Angelobacter sp.]|nr:antibiotic biosynthesis monooxygenase [Candidatus Angelobacter sp.]
MFARVVEITTKAGKAKDVARIISGNVLTILKSQDGFLDEITLVSNQDPNRVIGISFWQTEQDAAKYQREQFANVTEKIRSVIEGTPQVRTFSVEQSTAHNIVAERVA